MDIFVLRKMAKLLKVGLFCMQEDNTISFLDDAEQNPLTRSSALRRKLLEGANLQEMPYIYRTRFQIYFACIKTEEAYWLIGPMATEYLNRVQRHEFYNEMNVELDLDKNLHLFTLAEVLQIICLLAKLLLEKEYTDEELVRANHLITESQEKTRVDSVRYSLKTEEDEEAYRHSYQQERDLLNAVREGNVSEAILRNKEMDMNVGRMSVNDLFHWQSVLIIGATLCARAAIEGGVAPYTAYRVSGYYINKGSTCKDVLQILTFRNQAVEALTKAVYDHKTKRHTSSYTEQCKDYVRRHFREKIYLDEIAGRLGISSSYLSRTFKKETGISLQDYIVDIRVERAANLLTYSEEPIPRIAEYVNFPSQSYFGRVFKEKKQMTPRAYREKYKPKEFIE